MNTSSQEPHLNDSIEDLEQHILTMVSQRNEIGDTWDFAKEVHLDHQVVVGVIKSLLVDRYLLDEPVAKTYWTVSTEGQKILSKGSPEIQVMNMITDQGILLNNVQKELGDIGKVGLGVCMKNKWVIKDGENIRRSNQIQEFKDEVKDQLQTIFTYQDLEAILPLSEEDLKNLKKRKLIQQVTRKSFRIIKGPEFKEKRVRRMADLHKNMLGSNASEMSSGGTHWSEVAFKPFNLNAMGAPTTGGTYHPLLKVRAEFRRILMEMGFEEMPTNKWVESSFWNFDALFQPQSHPARDAHDTFFMKDPEYANGVPEDYYETVKETHEKGGFDSIGYGCQFKREDAMKNILRTHTTAISAQMLYRLANQFKETGVFTPKKYFSIDRVFRNEDMDATHLCEFHQVEGFVADRNLTLGNLIGIIKTFFEKIGIQQLRFKPAYNPYTEPSMEIFGYHPQLKKWTEIGNSGMFRPEMLRPMGMPEDVRVIAWGLSLERPTMIKYRIENIRDLFGHKADLDKQRNAPIAWF